jgi:hypothetical protein
MKQENKMDHMKMPMKDLNKHIDRVEKEQSGDTPVSSSDRKYLKMIKDVRAKRMAMTKTKVGSDNSYDVTENYDTHFEKQSKKMQDAINLHLRKGKSYPEAVKAAKVHVKEEVETNEGIIKGTASLVKHSVGVPVKTVGRAAMGAVNAVHSMASGIKNTVKDVKDASKKVKAAYAEEVENIDELSRGKIEKYHDARWLQNRQLKRQHRSIYGTDPEVEKKIDKNDKSLQLAYKKMAAKKYGMTQPKVNATEEVETIDEISLKTKIKAYSAASQPDADVNYGSKVYNQADRLRSVIVKKHGEKAGQHADSKASADAYGRSEPGRTPSDYFKKDKLKDAKPASAMRTTKTGMINKQDVASKKSEIKSRLTKEDLDLSEVLKASDPVGKWIDDFVHSDNPKFNGKTKEERRKMALGAYYAAQKESYEYSTEELAEGRGRPPKEGSKAWHAAQAKASSGEGSDQEADKNIVNQMRKKPVADMHHLVFANGEKKAVHAKHVNKALSMLANTPKPADREKLQSSLGHSHKRFMDTVTSGKAVEDSARPKVSLGKMRAEAVDTADSGPEKTYIENGKVVVRKKARKVLNIENLDLEIENSLNNLYLNLSESNQELFLDLISTDEGLVDLINFAKDQGF